MELFSKKYPDSTSSIGVIQLSLALVKTSDMALWCNQLVTLADAPQKDRSPEAASIDWTIWDLSENWNCGIT